MRSRRHDQSNGRQKQALARKICKKTGHSPSLSCRLPARKNREAPEAATTLEGASFARRDTDVRIVQVVCSQGDRRADRRQKPGYYRRLGASFVQSRGERGAEPGRYDALRATFLRRGSRRGGRKPFRVRPLGQEIVRWHGVLRRAKRVLSPGGKPRSRATDTTGVKRASFAARRFARFPPQVVRAQKLTERRYLGATALSGGLLGGLATHTTLFCGGSVALTSLPPD